MSEERRGIKESSDNMLVGLGKVFVGPLTELRNLKIGYHPYGLERVNRWRVELMEELSDGSDVGGACYGGRITNSPRFEISNRIRASQIDS